MPTTCSKRRPCAASLNTAIFRSRVDGLIDRRPGAFVLPQTDVGHLAAGSAELEVERDLVTDLRLGDDRRCCRERHGHRRPACLCDRVMLERDLAARAIDRDHLSDPFYGLAD